MKFRKCYSAPVVICAQITTSLRRHLAAFGATRICVNYARHMQVSCCKLNVSVWELPSMLLGVFVRKMGAKRPLSVTRSLLCQRWSFPFPIFCYAVLLLTFWLLSVPLKPHIRIQIPNDSPMDIRLGAEDTFEIRLKNSNFNSDDNKRAARGGGGVGGGAASAMEGGEEKNADPMNDPRNEYLINVDNKENLHKDQAEILEEVFHKADKDKNNKLDSRELAEWIRRKIVEHISWAVSNNYGLFTLIDRNPRNGVVTWKEYHAYFLKKRGFSRKYVKHHDEKRHKGLERSLKEQIMRDKASWMEAARSNPDALTLDEFLAFTHPESSATNHLALVDELYDKFDRDGDELLTEDEFAVLQTEGAEDETVVIRQDENERRAEFRKNVDLNGDGRADRRELLRYVAPQSPRHSEHEAEALLALADNDQDNMLSLDEILSHPNLFLKSKMVDTARSFHDEF